MTNMQMHISYLHSRLQQGRTNRRQRRGSAWGAAAIAMASSHTQFNATPHVSASSAHNADPITGKANFKQISKSLQECIFGAFH